MSNSRYKVSGGSPSPIKIAFSLNSNPLIPVPVKPAELNMSLNPFIVSSDKINFTLELCKAN